MLKLKKFILMVSYEYLKEDLPGFQEHLVVLHQKGEHGVLVPVLV